MHFDQLIEQFVGHRAFERQARLVILRAGAGEPDLHVGQIPNLSLNPHGRDQVHVHEVTVGHEQEFGHWTPEYDDDGSPSRLYIMPSIPPMPPMPPMPPPWS